MFQFPMMTLLVVALASSASGDKDAATDDARLQGTWEVVSAESHGEVCNGAVATRLVFASGKIRVTKTPRDIYFQITYTLNPTKRPRQIDIVAETRSEEAETKGIYHLDGDKLTLCIAWPSEPDVIYDDPLGFMYLRPKKFSSGVHTLLVLQRVNAPQDHP